MHPKTIATLNVKDRSAMCATNCSDVQLGSGGGMNPIIGARAAKKRTLNAIPDHQQNSCVFFAEGNIFRHNSSDWIAP